MTPESKLLNPSENSLLSSPGLLLKMELRSNPALLSVVRGALTPLTEKFGFPELESAAVVLAVDEALTNIIRHAYQGEMGQPIEASFSSIRVPQDGAPQPALEILLEDEGARVDRANLRGRPLDEVRPGGLGLHFIRQSMDTVEFRHRKGKNQLRLVKILHNPEPDKHLTGEKR
jgi:serine/threonine-protein kinase RsbW